MMTPKACDEMSDTTRDWSTIYTPSTTTETIDDDLTIAAETEPQATGSVPWPGSKYIIRSKETGDIIKIEGGQVVVGEFRWDHAFECVERNGWLGFRETKYLKFLGYNEHGALICSTTKQGWWEDFCVRQTPEGGYLLLMAWYDNWATCGDKKLRRVGFKQGQSHFSSMHEDLNTSCFTVWEFVKAD